MFILEAIHLKKSFGSGNRRVEAVKDVSLIVGQGEILAFLGPNGAGKTTTIKMIAGLIIPDAGSVRVNGKNPHGDVDVHQEIGAVLEGSRNIYLPLTVRENLEYFGVLKGMTAHSTKQRASELIEWLGLTHKSNTKTSELSRGMQQKLAIAVSLLHRPALFLLDEPTIGLDVEAAEHIKSRLKALACEGHAIVLTTHQLDVAHDLASRVAIIRNGTIIAEETTQSLIERFSGKTYTIKCAGIPSAEQAVSLAALGVQLNGEQLTFDGDAQELYKVLAILEPVAITSVERGNADLTEVFFKIIKE